MDIEVKNSVKPVDYVSSIKILEKRVDDIISGKQKELLWVLEHNTVYTAGTSYNQKDLLDKNQKIIRTKRGGKLTIHSEGQKVIYFVLNLNKRSRDIRKLVNKVENCIINILSEYKIESYADKRNIGIWTGDKKNSKKIAAIGIKVRKWIAYHGFSINVFNDLRKYDKIVPCGIKNKGITSIKNMGVQDYKNIDKVIIDKFLDSFL